MRARATPVLAVVGERVLAGDALLYTDRSGTLDLRAEGEPALSCMGAMRCTASTSGTVHLRCNDGLQAQLSFNALTETSGQGSGRTAAGGMITFTYGLEPEAARAWLTPPGGKRLVVSGKSLRLE